MLAAEGALKEPSHVPDRNATRRPILMHVITQAAIGGATLHTVELARALSARFDVHLVWGEAPLPEHPAIATAMRELEVHAVSDLRREIDLRDDVRAVRGLERLMARIRPDVVNTHSSKAGLVGRLASSRLGIPTVHTIHGWGHSPVDSMPRRRALIAAERWAARRCALLAAVSADVRDEGVRLGIGRPSQYRVVPAWVSFSPSCEDFDEARSRARSAIGLAAGTEVVGWVGRFMPQKDPTTLARALCHLLRARDRTWAVLVGDGPDRGRLEQMLADGGVADRVRLLGTRHDVRELYAAFDVVMHTSLWEGHPRVVQESIAERVPVVTARVSGVRDIVVDERVGTIVEPGDAIGFARACAALLDDRANAVPVPRDVVALVERTNGARASLDAHLGLYDELLAIGRTPGARGRYAWRRAASRASSAAAARPPTTPSRTGLGE